MRRFTRIPLLAVLALDATSCSPEPRADRARVDTDTPPRLIPIDALFDNPVAHSGTISPDGRWLAYLKVLRGQLNVFIRPADLAATTAERAITRDTLRSIPDFWWSADGRRVLFLQDNGGDEAYHLFVVEVADPLARPRDLTPFTGIEVGVVALSPHAPNVALITLNRRDPRYADAYRVDLRTGALDLAAVNPGTFLGYVADRAHRVRVAYDVDARGRYGLWERATERTPWRLVRRYPVEDKVTPLRFHADGRRLYMVSNHTVDLSRLVLVDLADGREEVIHEDPQHEVDIGTALFDEATDELLATRYVGDTARLYPHTTDVEALLGHAWRSGAGDLELVAHTRDRDHWVITRGAPTAPAAAYVYTGATGRFDAWYRTRPSLEGYALAEMQPISYRSHDGLTIHGYLTTPPGVAARALPLVVLVHGGPWERDTRSFQANVQLLANRGYAVLQVNFRGSTGYGKAFARAAKKQFARAMHTDLLDGVRWAVDRGVADSRRVAIMGGSYGGYAALVGLTFTPERFRCAVDYAGSSSLVTLLESFPPSWGPFLPRSWYPFVGDPRVAADRADLLSRSPLLRVDSARAPLLIFQGANDPRVTKQESDAIAVALHSRGVPVTYLLASNEGHSFGQAQTGMAVSRATELFLTGCLGGRSEPAVSPSITAALSAMRVNLDSLAHGARSSAR